MILNKILITNITSFKGEHVLSFEHTPQRSVSIISGDNGAGKTSLLQAMKVGLYGQFLFNNNKNKYLDYIDGFIRSGESSASIELDFRQRTLSGIEDFTVKRSWQRNDGKIKETLIILKNNEQYQEVTPKFFQEFIFSIIPLGMMELFFFDGEKINNLGESLRSGEISSAVKKLIGLSAVSGLEEAVSKYQSDSLKHKKDYQAILKAQQSLKNEKAAFHKEGEALHLRFAELNEAIKKGKKKLGDTETAFYEMGGNLASSHGALQARKTQLEKQLEEDSAKIKELSQSYLPLCVLSDELDELAEQLVLERKGEATQIVQEFAKERALLVDSALAEEGVPDRIRQIALNALEVPEEPTSKPIHNISATQTDEVLSAIGMVQDVIRPQALGVFSSINNAQKELSAIDSALEKVPDKYALSDTLSEMRKLNTKLSVQEAQLEEVVQKKKRVEGEINAIDNKLLQLAKQLEKGSSESKSEELAKQFPRVLARIKDDFFERRLKSLQRLILHNIRRLFRKDLLIHDVNISNDFSVELFGPAGSSIDLKRLSAGEQQILATAIQWALASVASGNIPTIIDTPLARLDSHHRRSLVQNYYPAIEQLILLSTDEEIDSELLADIRHKVSDVYALQHDQKYGCTEIVRIETDKALSEA
ncbi:DNA sulfur modification protein DndD [Desulfovibrio oxyclinae]|uniref:DNA sulfur modification protein DndD n=1 Tax=Desulfovibrio oxyclinae TaxID=63560 RepID=UPI00035F5FDD|nr:DNA sulfur modification protein DndD [Desulfovibrio oxyclinae]